MDNKEPENPVVYLSNLVKRLDAKNRNGIVALAIVNVLVILLFKFYLKGVGLLSWVSSELFNFVHNSKNSNFKILGYNFF